MRLSQGYALSNADSYRHCIAELVKVAEKRAKPVVPPVAFRATRAKLTVGKGTGGKGVKKGTGRKGTGGEGTGRRRRGGKAKPKLQILVRKERANRNLQKAKDANLVPVQSPCKIDPKTGLCRQGTGFTPLKKRFGIKNYAFTHSLMLIISSIGLLDL